MTSVNWSSVQTGLLQVHVEKSKATAVSQSISQLHAHSLPVLTVPESEPMWPFTMNISTKMLSKNKDIDKTFFNEILSEMRQATSVIQITRKGYVHTLCNNNLFIQCMYASVHGVNIKVSSILS